MIRHTAVFRLKHPAGSRQEQEFLQTLWKLQAIPGVGKFEVLRQVNPKSEYAFGVSMEFASDDAYQGYNLHPDHVAFVRDRWLPEVAAFTEIDYIPLDPP